MGRFLFKHREAFAARVVELTKEFIADPETSERIQGDREAEVGGICLSAMIAAHEIIEPGTSMPNAPEFKEFMLKHMGEACSDTSSDVFTINFFADSVNMINRGVPHVDRYLRVCRGVVGEGGRITVIRDITDDRGQIVVLIAYRELYNEYLADKARTRESAAIARSNIQAELKAEDAWIKFEEPPRIHRYRLPGKNGGFDDQRNCWALDYEKCQPELKEVFRSIYERELQAFEHALNDDDEVVHVRDLDRQPEDMPF